MLLCSTALAEIDLSGMSFEELLDLRNAVDKAIWASDGWQEVEVPAGAYVIGEDIPAGKWNISAKGIIGTMTLYPDKSDYDNQTYNFITMQMLQQDDTYNLTVSEGQCVVLDSSTFIFKPYTGAGLGFK